MSYADDEYAPMMVTKAHWRMLKFSGHHGSYLCTYEVRKAEAGWWCTCAAGHNCKHIKLVQATIAETNTPNKKSLF